MAEPQISSAGRNAVARPSRTKWMAAIGVLLVAGVLIIRYLTAPTPTLYISSGDPGDLYFQVGAALQDVLEDAFPGFPQGRDIDFVNLASRGATENVSRIVAGDAQLGLAEEGVELDHRHGRSANGGPAGAESPVQLQVRSLVQMFNSPLKIVARRDLETTGARGKMKLESLGDLRRLIEARRAQRLPPLKVFIGAEGSGTRKMARLVLEHYGFALGSSDGKAGTADLLVVGHNWTFAEVKRGLETGDLAAAFFLTAFGTNAVSDLAGKGRFILLAVDRAPGIQRSHPFMDVVTIPASSYPAPVEFPPHDIQTLAVDETLIASSELSDKVAYRIAETLFNHSHEMASSLPFMTPLSKAAQLAQHSYYPPHPGAVAFYQGRPEPQGLVDFLQRYRDFLLGLFSLGGTAWAALHFLAGRWRSKSLVKRLLQNPSEAQIHEIEHEASHLFATGKINKEIYESVKEYVRVRLNEVSRKP